MSKERKFSRVHKKPSQPENRLRERLCYVAAVLLAVNWSIMKYCGIELNIPDTIIVGIVALLLVIGFLTEVQISLPKSGLSVAGQQPTVEEHKFTFTEKGGKSDKTERLFQEALVGLERVESDV